MFSPIPLSFYPFFQHQASVSLFCKIETWLSVYTFKKFWHPRMPVLAAEFSCFFLWFSGAPWVVQGLVCLPGCWFAQPSFLALLWDVPIYYDYQEKSSCVLLINEQEKRFTHRKIPFPEFIDWHSTHPSVGVFISDTASLRTGRGGFMQERSAHRKFGVVFLPTVLPLVGGAIKPCLLWISRKEQLCSSMNLEITWFYCEQKKAIYPFI